MIFGSLFSGIEAASVAWHPLGWRCAWVAEIDPFASAVLKHHYPDVPNLGDVNRIDPDAIEPVDLVVFGSPCQSFSVAGKRLGLDDPRGNMALVGLRVVGKLRPRWVVWENVPGVLSSDGGRDFGAFLGLLGELGYGFAHTVLDAQHFGVPQRRRRVFVVGHLGDWRGAAAVLFEPESLRGDSPPRRQEGQGVARPVASCAPGGSGYRNDADTAACWTARDHKGPDSDTKPGHLIVPPLMSRSSRGGSQPLSMGFQTDEHIVAFDPRQIGHPANHSNPKPGDPCHPLRGVANCEPVPLDMRQISHGEDEPRPNGSGGGCGGGVGNAGDPAYTVTEVAHAVMTLAYGIRSDAAREGSALTPSPDAEGRARLRDPGFNVYEETAPTLDSTAHAVQSAMSVRRLTPRECERLQGLPDNWTLVPYRGKPAADGNRYRATGNSMAVPVIAWLGRRIQLVSDTNTELSDAAE